MQKRLYFKTLSLISKLSKYCISTLLLLALIGCKSREFITYNELSFEERSLYDSTFKDISSRSSKNYAHIIAKKSIVAKRNSDWVHNTMPQLPSSFKNAASGDIIHSLSNANFQLNIGRFVRSEKNIHQHDKVGNSISVGYGFHGPIHLSLIQYVDQNSNAKIGLEKKVEEIKSRIKNYHHHSNFIKKDDLKKDGIHLLHKYHIGEQEVYSANYLFLANQWMINVSATFPIENKTEAELEIKKYLKNMPLPIN